MKNLEMRKGTTEANFANRTQEIKERIQGFEHKIEEMKKSVQENVKSKILLT